VKTVLDGTVLGVFLALTTSFPMRVQIGVLFVVAWILIGVGAWLRRRRRR
jgi:predicted DNA-binding transcriptional regulator AlpA